MQGTFEKAQAGALVLAVKVPNPFGYGRIVRDANNQFEKIVEEADADALSIPLPTRECM